jgi:predicted nucleic acid-binding protein
VRLVIDASVAIYLAASADGFSGLAPHDAAAPPLMWSECLSALHESLWRRAISTELADRSRSAIRGAPIERSAPDELAEEAWRVASELGWAKTYDAEYVALARLMDRPLLTRDDRLARGAERIVRVVRPLDLAPAG